MQGICVKRGRVVHDFKWDSYQHIAQKFKGGTSNILRTGFPELIETIDKRSLWESGYLCVTNKEKSMDMIERYKGDV